MTQTFSLLFYIKGKCHNPFVPVPIYMRITVDGKRSEMSTARKIDPEKWDAKAGRMRGNTQEASELNHYLDMIRAKINKIHYQFIESEKPFTARQIKERYLQKDQRFKMLMEVFEEHNRQMKSLVGKEYALGTWKRYNTTFKHTREFLKTEYRRDDIPMMEVDLRFINRFDYFLKFTKECNHNSSLKYINNFKKIIRMGVANDWIQKDPFYNFKAKFKWVDREYLTREELERLINYEVTVPRMGIVKDMFVFCCFTGLAYIDVKKLTPNNIVKHIDGSLWIQSARQKTRSKLGIPLLPTALEIIEKYEDHPKVVNGDCVIPVLSNQRSNAYLKEIADICGITKHLTTHLARHTFATTVTLSNGVPIETVGKLLGHRNLRATQHYAKIVNKKVADDMAALKNVLNLRKPQKETPRPQNRFLSSGE
ncbi:site-specific integrase [Robiginitalea biformata]|uniref:Tyrosine type site-specific recombinase n=1 Tax=Robiginitalea biformata (strain ATCC BAA-864 / DSM 15991 / KCTC 12146 / HTCC2501) TaxID=313596 RepID=A4CM29_ROBBH|nr:site-specific integrase [Robiginitalea biformata]EAR14721.1 tyrosine type site-specific recombinase [Robiginitalea biformata HTCC2501]